VKYRELAYMSLASNPDFDYEDQTQSVGYTTTEFHDAVHDLVGMRKGSIDTDSGRRVGVRDSRYAEMTADIKGQQGTDLGGVARSMPPLWVDAVDWLEKVDTAVADWVGEFGRASTPDRLYSLSERTWRPQDVPMLQRMTENILRWCKKADFLLDPPERHQWELVAPCPACESQTVYRPDSGGEWVRQAALAVNEEGCVCLSCDAKWSPDYFRFLASAIGCPLPEGVLE
jgi:hypothetical protein